MMKAFKSIKVLKSSFSTTHNLATLIDLKRELSHKKFQLQNKARLIKGQYVSTEESAEQEIAAQ